MYKFLTVKKVDSHAQVLDFNGDIIANIAHKDQAVLFAKVFIIQNYYDSIRVHRFNNYGIHDRGEFEMIISVMKSCVSST